MAQTKVDYPQLKREYVTAEERPSLRAMAKREGISNSTISAYAKKDDWDGERAKYQRKLLDEFIDTTAVKNAKRLARLSELTVDVLEGTLARYAEQLVQHLDEDGKQIAGKDPIGISPKDAVEAIRLIRELSMANSRQSEEKPSGGVTINIGRDLLDAVGELARGALQSRGTSGPRPVALPGGATVVSGRVKEGKSA